MVLANLKQREEILKELKKLEIWTNHLKKNNNFKIGCAGITYTSAREQMALNGYLGIKIPQYYYIKHNIRLEHAYLPCLIDLRAKNHFNYFPFEILNVYV